MLLLHISEKKCCVYIYPKLVGSLLSKTARSWYIAVKILKPGPDGGCSCAFGCCHICQPKLTGNYQHTDGTVGIRQCQDSRHFCPILSNSHICMSITRECSLWYFFPSFLPSFLPSFPPSLLPPFLPSYSIPSSFVSLFVSFSPFCFFISFIYSHTMLTIEHTYSVNWNLWNYPAPSHCMGAGK